MVNWHLIPNEKKIHDTTMSRKVFLKYYLGAIILIILAIAALSLPFVMPDIPIPSYIAGTVLILLSLIPAGIAEMKRRREMILITTDRILVRKFDKPTGSVNIEAIPFDKLTNIRVKQTRTQRMLHIGDVVFIVASTEHILKDVDSPYVIEKAVYRIIEKEKARARK